MCYLTVYALRENCIFDRLKFCERIKNKSWSSALRNRTLNCSWYWKDRFSHCFVYKFHVGDHMYLLRSMMQRSLM